MQESEDKKPKNIVELKDYKSNNYKSDYKSNYKSGDKSIGEVVANKAVGELNPNNSDDNADLNQIDLDKGDWDKSVASLKTELDPHIFAAYIKPLRPTSYNREISELLVSAPSSLICRHVNDNYKDRLAKTLQENLGIEGLQIRFAVDVAEKSRVNDSAPSSKATSSFVVVKRISNVPQAHSETSNRQASNQGSSDQLNPRYTFSSFVVGNSNQFCHAAALRVAEAPGQTYNPLFIYGGVGLGKTHLLHAIGNQVRQTRPGMKILYMSSETFTNDLIQSLRAGKMDAFKNKLREIDILLIDDIQFMCGKERTQEEFFHTFNALYGAKNQIVLTSDKLPQDIPGIEERLRTRFSWGLTADLQAPDFETRVAILKRKASQDNVVLPEDVAHYIGENIASNVRELEGALTRLSAVSSIQKVSITKELAISALKQILQPKQINISVDDIKGAVANHFKIKVSDMVSKRRTRNLSFPRHIAMFLCRKHTTASYPEIGLRFGGRDHSSVIHAANVVAEKLKDNNELVASIKTIEADLFA